MLPTACPKPDKRIRLPKTLKARKRINARNPERAAESFERDYGAKASWVRSLVCVVSGSEGSEFDPIVAAHVCSRGAGGDSRDLVPMLMSLHDRSHQIGAERFAAEHPNVDLEAAADIIELRWKAFSQSASERTEHNPASLSAETVAGAG